MKKRSRKINIKSRLEYWSIGVLEYQLADTETIKLLLAPSFFEACNLESNL